MGDGKNLPPEEAAKEANAILESIKNGFRVE